MLTVRNIKRVLQDERGSQFIENALWIILFTFAVAILVGNLADATSIKFQQMTQRIEQVGTP